MNSTLPFKIIAVSIFFAILSCSKDNEEPTLPETEIMVSTSDFSKAFDENPINGQIIGTVNGSTNQGNVTFAITEQTPAGAFSIDAASGELKVANETIFDFETNTTISGTVKVANGSVFENASVTITLNDLVEDNIFDDSIVLFTQEEVNDFGANNYTHITGSLLIGKIDNSQSSINDLTPLHALKSIGQHFIIIDNPLLSNLAGLENLEFIGEYFSISDNQSLTTIASLSKLTSINGYLSIDYNDQLINLSGLENINAISGNLHIIGNNNLIEINNLSNLASVGNDISINDNKLLQNFSLPNLTNIPGKLMLLNNFAITNLDGLSNLSSIDGDLTIQLNYLLENFCGLSNVFIGGYFNGTFIVWGNAYDPTQQDLIDGNCSL